MEMSKEYPSLTKAYVEGCDAWWKDVPVCECPYTTEEEISMWMRGRSVQQEISTMFD